MWLIDFGGFNGYGLGLDNVGGSCWWDNVDDWIGWIGMDWSNALGLELIWIGFWVVGSVAVIWIKGVDNGFGWRSGGLNGWD